MKLVGKQRVVSTFRVGTLVVAVRDLPHITPDIKVGMRGTVFERSDAYGDGFGPMVRFENGHCGNVYDPDVQELH